MPEASSWVVHKFGGTSVADAERYRHVAKIVENQPGPRLAVVVSAMSKVTDALISLVDLAKQPTGAYQAAMAALEEKHVEAATALLPADARAEMVAVFKRDFGHIADLLKAVRLSRTAGMETIELISGHGELWSAQLLAAYWRSQGRPVTWLDAREVVIVESSERVAIPLWEASQAKADAWLKDLTTDLVVITGFLASRPDGVATTLKRNGSDFSASIFGALLKARAIVIWTDVDGVLTADPRLVPDAVIMNELSYNELTELAYFGAKVVHPSTMAPAVKHGIPLWIRNTFNPDHPGTKIHAQARSDGEIKGIATIDRIALVNVEGSGMIGVPGIAERLFGALREADVSVIMISQASSEHSICFACSEAHADAAKLAVEKAFYAERHQGLIQTISVVKGCTTIAIVGDNMIKRPGVAGKFLSALGQASVNVRAIAQGASERNISAVIDSATAVKALRATHAAYYLSPQTISIGVVGAGRIGTVFLDQLRRQTAQLKRDHGIDLRVHGITGSKTMLLADRPIDLDNWQSELKKSTTPTDRQRFAEHLKEGYLPHAAIIDLTASRDVAEGYANWLSSGLHVISASKIANTLGYDYYAHMREMGRQHRRHFLYETNVGAGLPIIRTLRDIIQSGDQIQKIEGVFSGTLSFLFSDFDGTKPFSDSVKEATARGYTEPDSRDDLSGLDVARKLIILAREAGFKIDLSDLKVDSLVPAALRDVPRTEWEARLGELDEPMSKRCQEANLRGEVLRYVGVIEHDGRAYVSLRPYLRTHPFGGLAGGDNIVAFTTDRYNTRPLVVQGPGAGPEVTAAGVFADLLRLAANLGGQL